MHVTSGSGSSCSVPQPIPSLPPRLRSLGGFDQPQDPSDTLGLQAFAAQAASAMAPGLIGTVAQGPVRVRSLTPGEPDALVVPLLSTQPGAQPRKVVAGLVSLLLDCTGRAYYSAVDDLTLDASTAPAAFPAVSAVDAEARLGSERAELVYTRTPFAPKWRNPDSGQTIAAFSA